VNPDGRVLEADEAAGRDADLDDDFSVLLLGTGVALFRSRALPGQKGTE
jgi:hypothetical protein